MKTIKIQEWRMPRLTREDVRLVNRGSRAFWARKGIHIADDFGEFVRGAARVGKAAKDAREREDEE